MIEQFLNITSASQCRLKREFEVGSSTSLLAGVKAGCVHLCLAAGKTVCFHVASDTPQICDRVPLRVKSSTLVNLT